MKIQAILTELDEAIKKLKIKIIFYETENKLLKKQLYELKKYVANN